MNVGKTPEETEYVCLMPGTLEHALLEALIMLYRAIHSAPRDRWKHPAYASQIAHD